MVARAVRLSTRVEHVWSPARIPNMMPVTRFVEHQTAMSDAEEGAEREGKEIVNTSSINKPNLIQNSIPYLFRRFGQARHHGFMARDELLFEGHLSIKFIIVDNP